MWLYKGACVFLVSSSALFAGKPATTAAVPTQMLSATDMYHGIEASTGLLPELTDMVGQFGETAINPLQPSLKYLWLKESEVDSADLRLLNDNPAQKVVKSKIAAEILPISRESAHDFILSLDNKHALVTGQFAKIVWKLYANEQGWKCKQEFPLGYGSYITFADPNADVLAAKRDNEKHKTEIIFLKKIRKSGYSKQVGQ